MILIFIFAFVNERLLTAHIPVTVQSLSHGIIFSFLDLMGSITHFFNLRASIPTMSVYDEIAEKRGEDEWDK